MQTTKKCVAAVDQDPRIGGGFASIYVGYAARGRAGVDRSR